MALRLPSDRASLVAFVVRALAIFALWFVVYDLWLLPDGRLDAALSHAVARAAAGVLAVAGEAVTVTGRVVRIEGSPGVEVLDGCNGLTTLGLFIGFVVAYPGPWRRRAWFIPAGLALVALVNVARVAVLAAVQAHAPTLFDATHAVGASTIFYLTVFALWVVWARLSDRDATPGPPSEATLAPPASSPSSVVPVGVPEPVEGTAVAHVVPRPSSPDPA